MKLFELENNKNSKIPLLTVVILNVVCVPAIALAAGEYTIDSLSVKAFNFAIFFAVLIYIYKSKVSPIVRARSIQISDHLKKVSIDIAKVEGELENAKERLAEIKDEQQEIIKQLTIEGDAAYQEIIGSAHQSVAQLRTTMSRRIQNEFKNATAQVREEVLKAASELAKEKLIKELSESQDSKLREQTLELIQKAY